MKFWNWIKNEDKRVLHLNGAISETSWFDDDVTPDLFKSELEEGEGDIDLWINSPGGDCFAAAQIYNMISNYKGKVTVYIDGLAASAASVIAMAGDEVIMSPVSMLMIHNPSTIAFGEAADMAKAIEMLGEVKDSIINAYVAKTGLSRGKLSRLMDEETWMNANKALELGFADRVGSREGSGVSDNAVMFSQRKSDLYVTNLLTEKLKIAAPDTLPETTMSDNTTPSDTPHQVETAKTEDSVVNIIPTTSDNIAVTDTPAGRNRKEMQERLGLIKSFIGGK